ncbi:MAG: S8 family peptidase [Acidovorax sp.]|uniref:S8 family peptidase n=1 Tax=Acidovorax sp. TaxID=1872122 RepID=UPI00391C6468
MPTPRRLNLLRDSTFRSAGLVDGAFVSKALIGHLKSPGISALLTAPVAKATLDTSRIAAQGMVTNLRAVMVSKRSTKVAAASDRIAKLRARKGAAIKAAFTSRAKRTPAQVIAAFLQRAALPADRAAQATGVATLIVRSTEADGRIFRDTLAKALAVDLARSRIGVSRIPLAKGAVTSYSVTFPIAHQQVRTEILNLAWALRESKLFRSVGVSGLQASLFAATPTAATHAERNFDWHLDLTRTTRAHRLQPAAGGRALGEGITIAHIDTGWADHSQYNVERIDVANSINVITRARGGTSAKHSIRNGDSDSPNISHGTATGSVILGGKEADGLELVSSVSDADLRFNTWPNGTRMHVPGRSIRDSFGQLTGAAPRATVLPIKFISDTAAAEISSRGVSGLGVFRLFDNDLIRGIRDAIDGNAHVISLSIGGLMHDEVREIIDEAVRDHDIIIAAAVGQTYLGNVAGGAAAVASAIGVVADDTVVLPAAYANVIAVAGCTPGGAPWSETHYGPNVDISAPADAVWIADYLPKDNRSAGATRRETLECASGTSFAAPLVASAAALWLAHHGRAALIQRYRPQGVPLAWVFRHLLQATARTPSGWDDGRYGPGILDTEALLRAPLPPAADIEEPPGMVSGLVPGISDGLVAFHDGFLELVNWIGEQKDGAERQAAVLWAAGQQALDDAIDGLGEVWAAVDAGAKGAVAAVQQEADRVKREIEQDIDELLRQKDEVIEKAGKAVEETAEQAGEAIEDFVDTVGEAASDTVDFISGFFPR